MSIWADMVQDYDAFLKLRESTNPVVQKCVRRSYFQWPEVKEMFEYAWPLDERSKRADQIFHYIGDTHSIERYFQVKSDAIKDTAALRISPSTFWRTLVRQHVFSTVFKFDEVDANDVKPGVTVKTELPKALYRNKLRKTSINFPMVCRGSRTRRGRRTGQTRRLTLYLKRDGCV